MFYYLIYASTASHRMSTAELRDLLLDCRRNNAAVGVTGALLYHDGTFLQVLEGDRNIVEAIYHKLQHDSRHYDVTPMISKDAETRQFADWSMAFKQVGVDAGDLAEGFSEFMNSRHGTPTYGDAPTAAQRVLISFRDHLAAVS